MRKDKIFKVVLILTLVIGISLLGISTNVYAVDNENIFIDIPVEGEGTGGSTTPPPANPSTPNENTNLNTNLNGNTNNNANYNTNLPEAGLAENTMFAVLGTILVIVAIVAYKKVNEYKNI